MLETNVTHNSEGVARAIQQALGKHASGRGADQTADSCNDTKRKPWQVAQTVTSHHSDCEPQACNNSTGRSQMIPSAFYLATVSRCRTDSHLT